MNLDYIAIGSDPPEEVNAIIEVPIGGEPIKYEMDKKAGTLVVDRFLDTAMRYPGNYGFIPHTLSEDADPCDVLIANTRPIIPGAVIAVRPIGVLKMTDEGGGDEKIVAVPIPKLTQRYADVRSYTDLPEITARSSISLRITKTLKWANGQHLRAGATPTRRNALSLRRSTDLKVRVLNKVDS
jgi:inorganic pyrophosphatase